MSFMDLFQLWWRCDPRWRSAESSSTFLHMGCLHTFALFAFLGFLTSKLILSLSSGSNTFELLLIFSCDLVLPHLCTASFEIEELELTDRNNTLSVTVHHQGHICSSSFGSIYSSSDAPILLNYAPRYFQQIALACICT